MFCSDFVLINVFNSILVRPEPRVFVVGINPIHQYEDHMTLKYGEYPIVWLLFREVNF